MTLKTIDNKSFLCFIGDSYFGVVTMIAEDNWTAKDHDDNVIATKCYSMSDATRRVSNRATINFM